MDMRTIYIVFSVMSAVALLVLWMALAHLHAFPGSKEWLSGVFLTACGTLFLSLQGTVPDFLSIQLGNIILPFGPAYLFLGLNRFFDRTRFHRAGLLLALLLSTGFLFVSCISGLQERQVFLSLAYGLLWLPLAVTALYGYGGSERTYTRYLMGAGALALSILSLVRIIPLINIQLDEVEFFAPVGLYSLSSLLLIPLFFLIQMAYLLLVIERVSDERQQTIIDLEQMIGARNRIVSIVSHDIRGPLGAVQMGLDIVGSELRQWSSMDRDELLRLVAMVRDSIAGILKIQSDLMEWFRSVEAHGFRFEAINLRELLEPVLEHFKEHHPVMETDLSAHVVFGNVNGMRMIFRILMGRVSRMSAGEEAIRIGASEKEGQVIVRIQPDGSGTAGATVLPEKGKGIELLLMEEAMHANRVSVLTNGGLNLLISLRKAVR